MAEPILQFEAADLRSPDQPGRALLDVSFRLEAGASVVVQADQPSDLREEGDDTPPLADAAEGLIPCDQGQVLFKGRDWRQLSPFDQARNRGDIGRLFDFHGWVYNLSVLENMTLACHTHPSGSVSNPESRIRDLARRFGFDGVPPGRPVDFRRRELRIFEWIRALAFRRDLVILERPELDLPLSALDICFEMAQEARAAGSALLWITHDVEMVRRTVQLGSIAFVIRGRTWNRREETTV